MTYQEWQTFTVAHLSEVEIWKMSPMVVIYIGQNWQNIYSSQALNILLTVTFCYLHISISEFYQKD